MAIKTNTYETFDAVNLKEEVLKKIDRIEREETPIYSSARKEKIISKTPEWQTQALAAAGANAMIEGDAFAVNAALPTVRVKGHTQILRKVVSVTGTNQAVSKYGYANEMANQKALKTIELRRDCELAIVGNNASVAGVSDTTAAQMAGAEAWVESNVSRGTGGANGGWNSGTGVTDAATDGTQRPLTENLLLDVLQTGYDNGARFSVMHAGSHNKQVISSFSGGKTRFSDAEKKITNTVDIYESDYGTLAVAINPQQRSRSVLLYDMSKIAVLNLRPMSEGKLAKTNDSMEEYILTEMTTRVVEKGLGVIADLTTS